MAPPGRKQREPIERLVRLLSVLSEAGEAGVSAEKLIGVAGFPADAKDPGTQLTKEFRLLREQGWQIDSIGRAGEGGRYRLVKGDNRLRLALEPRQLAALQRAALLANRDDLTSKLGLPSSARPADVMLGAHDAELDQVMAAVRERRLVRFRYKGSPRKVHPGSLINQNGTWYLHGLQEGETVSKSFVVARISDLRLDPRGSAQPVEAVRRLTLHPMQWLVDPPEPVVLRAPYRFVPDVIRWLAEPAATTEHGEYVDLTYRITNRAALRSRIYLLADRVQVVSPESLREEILAELAEMC